MPWPIFYNSGILFSGGALAMSSDCCCSDISFYDDCCFVSPNYGFGIPPVSDPDNADFITDWIFENPAQGTYVQTGSAPAPSGGGACQVGVPTDKPFPSTVQMSYSPVDGSWRNSSSVPGGALYIGYGPFNGTIVCDIVSPPAGQEGATITFTLHAGDCSL